MKVAVSEEFVSDRRLLTDSSRWRLVTGWFPPEEPEYDDAACRQWLDGGGSESHHTREALFCLEGETSCGLDGKIYRCRPGTFMFFDTKAPHGSYYMPGTRDIRHLWFWFARKTVFASVIALDGKGAMGTSRSVILDQPVFCQWLNQEFGNLGKRAMPPEWKRQALLGLMMSLFVKTLEAAEAARLPVADGGDDLVDRQRCDIAMLTRHITESSGRDISLDRLARMANYSKYHFLRVFKKHTGLTVHEFVERTRLKKQAEMLAAHCRSKEIAAELGFSSSSAYANWQRALLKKR